MSDREAKCACLRVEYQPEDVEFDNPITGKPITGKRERWACVLCGAEFGRVLWQNAVVKDQQDRIRELEAEVARLKQDKADALNVRSKDGLLSSEWIARTGAAERRAEAAEAKLRAVGDRIKGKNIFEMRSTPLGSVHDAIGGELEALLKGGA